MILINLIELVKDKESLIYKVKQRGNYFPGLEIDYKTGGATVRPEYKDMITISTERDSTKNGDDIIVYYKSKKPKVYWYSEKN